MNIWTHLASLNFENVMNNFFVIILFRVVLLVINLKILHIIFKFFANRATEKMDNIKQKKQFHTIVITIESIADILIICLFTIELLAKLGIDIRPILTAAGVLGIAVGFGAKQLIEDLITGITLIMQGQIMVGDIIEIDGKLGIVEKLNMRMVVLRDWDGRVHYIRNGKIDIVTNYTREFAYAIVEYSISYSEDAEKVMEIIKDLANNDLRKGQYAKDIYSDVEVWGIDKFAESSVDLKFRIKTNPMKQWAVKRELNRLVKNKFDELGIEFPFPQTVIHSANLSH